MRLLFAFQTHEFRSTNEGSHMRVSPLLGLVLFCPPVIGIAQQLATTQAPSSLLQPALDSVARAGSSVDLNRWKGSSSARDEVDANLASMQKDLQATLPPLLAAADASPSSAAASLPVLLNLDALYSVLLRVAIASRNGAPRDQNTALEQAAMLLDSARRDIGDTVLTAAKAQEQRAAELQATLQQQAAALAAAQQVPTVPPPQPVKTKKKPASAKTSAAK